MSSNNKFYNDYNEKSSEELKSIALSDKYAGDSRLCAIGILKERNEFTDDLITIEKQIFERRTNRLANEFAHGSVSSIDRYNTGFRRFIALFIDGIIISIISWFFNKIYGIESALFMGLISLIVVTIPLLYNIILHGYCGQTFGKMLLGVKIFDKSETKQITYKQALTRDIIPLCILLVTQILSYFTVPNNIGLLTYISLFMGFTALIWSILEIVTMLFDSKRRALHDLIAGTIVLKIN